MVSLAPIAAPKPRKKENENQSVRRTRRRMPVIHSRLDTETAPAVLIVDDDDIVLRWLQETVTAAGYSVRTAGSGVEALHSMESSFASIVVTDLKMVGMDGLELCRRLRKRAWPGYLYIIVLTVQDAENDVHAGLDAGADDYISKRTSYAAQFTARLRAAKRFLALENSQNGSLEKKRKLSTTDAVTGVYNRPYFVRNLGLELMHSLRRGGGVSLLLLKFDHFQAVNDTFGHAIGDIVLKRLTRRMLKCLDPSTGWCAHLGGEEFAVVLEDTMLADAQKCAEKMRLEIANGSINTSRGTVRITVSIGISGVEESGHRNPVTVDSLLKMASANLYASKKVNGRICVTSPRTNVSADCP
jgi:two-component system cell cycle response regulator